MLPKVYKALKVHETLKVHEMLKVRKKLKVLKGAPERLRQVSQSFNL